MIACVLSHLRGKAAVMNSFVGGVRFQGVPIMIGAGAIRDPRTGDRWSQALPVVCGSYTLHPRPGNSGVTFYESPDGQWAVNWLSMPNVGAAEAANAFATYYERQTAPTLIVSVAGFSVEEIVAAVRHFVGALGKNLIIELNFGCPNTETGKIQSHDLPFMVMVFSTLRKAGLTKGIIYWVKLSHYTYQHEVVATADAIAEFQDFVQVIVGSNTVPYPNNKLGVKLPPGISPPEGQGGISGPIILELALQQVAWFVGALPASISVLGSGGATTGSAIRRHLKAGARGVQTTTLAYKLQNGAAVLRTLLEDGELETLT
jgi:dihydroorotate dehydrogenase